jgi:CRISPR-associated protein Cmr4
MYQVATPLFLYCETPLHAGTGSELGVVDLPIQRERHTSFPKIEGSSLKGALRERFEGVLNNNRKDADLFAVFGPEGDGTDNYAGAIGFTDARLLLFPVKSMKGVFAWVTCPQVLKRFFKDILISGKESMPFTEGDLPEPSQPGKAFVTNTTELILSNDRIVLEEYAFTVEKDDITSEIGNWLLRHLFGEDTWWQNKIANSLVLLHDEDFRDFVTLSTEVITRTKIDNKSGTVEDGALFTEEYLPESSVLYSLVLASPIFPGKDEQKKNKLSGKNSNEESTALAVKEFFDSFLESKAKNRFQLGANATLGKGLIRTTILK